jgi:drug/metabolite transporter (DMT)-like permease
LLAIPATCDIMGSTLMFIALTMVAGSVYQMMRGIIVPIVALMAFVFLKRKQYIHHVVSILLILAGVAIVGYSGLK